MKKLRILLAAMLLFSSSLMLGQVQLGTELNGDSTGNRFGYALALSGDGERMAVGAPYHKGAAFLLGGQARVFEWDGAEWHAQGSPLGGEKNGGLLGSSVSLSYNGTRLAVGAPGTITNSFPGLIRIYEWVDEDWVQLGDDLMGSSPGEQFGKTISLSADGNRIAVGAPTNNEPGTLLAGQVSLFEWNGTNWMLMGDPIEGVINGERSGSAVSLSADGTRVAIGAPSNPESGPNAGRIRVFEWMNETWIQIGNEIAGKEDWVKAGTAVSLSADGARLAIGAPESFTACGYAQVYAWDGQEWTQLGEDIEGEIQFCDAGASVSLSENGNRLAVGATDDPGAYGHIRLYEWNGENWSQAGLTIAGETPTNSLGNAVSLSADGYRLAAGADQNDDNGQNAGQVRVFGFENPNSLLSSSDPDNPIEVFPNPCRNDLYLTGVDSCRYVLLNCLGSIVQKGAFTGGALDLSSLPTGVYFLFLEREKQFFSTSIIKN